ncbi:MAG: type II toxin-antitoxin system RelE/ParE family toxin [Actinobacteria bacterium]|nr:type II toxin-antitoxin system RelE/ParE family toxin [Actinomycetota bacterium]
MQINKISTEPYSGNKLKGKYSNLWKYRIGSFRTIYTIRNKELSILILKLRHRKDIYDDILF